MGTGMSKYIGITFSKKANMWNVYIRYNDSKKPDISEYFITEKEAENRLNELQIKKS